ncbi:DUF6327 family protein [Pricia sp. S334]|uniref:DUF6327 family protein n=1 Tax=Pricia mediterranea TaxID=3076079 RepID=A0ABU3L6E5_9FLAO|nr:DUF6327 family protein [Pricia sp. S334]MDT7828901.1 DUF6327 family protein [Pricia sp. S334]
MIPKKYSSFEEIDQDLKILKLERDIAVENLKLTFQQTKSNLYPTSLLGGVGGIVKKFLISVVAKKVVNRFSSNKG